MSKSYRGHGSSLYHSIHGLRVIAICSSQDLSGKGFCMDLVGLFSDDSQSIDIARTKA